METPKHAVDLVPGWYPDSADPTSLRYWDGEAWGPRVPKPADPSPSGVPVRKIAAGVLVGILAAVATLTLLPRLFADSGPSDEYCREQRTAVLLGNAERVNPACY